MWEKIVNFFKSLWNKLVNFCKTKVWPWLKTEWVTIGSIAVLILAKIILPEDNGAAVVISLWLFVLGGTVLYRLWKAPFNPFVKTVEVERIVEKIVEKPVEVIKYVEKPIETPKVTLKKKKK